MTKDELIAALQANFDFVGDPKAGNVEKASGGTVDHWAVPVFRRVGDRLDRQWVHYYIAPDLLAYWQDRDPTAKPPPPPLTFGQRVMAFIKEKVADGTVRDVVVSSLSEEWERAQITALMADNTTKRALVRVGAGDKLVIEIIVPGVPARVPMAGEEFLDAAQVPGVWQRFSAWLRQER